MLTDIFHECAGPGRACCLGEDRMMRKRSMPCIVTDPAKVSTAAWFPPTQVT